MTDSSFTVGVVGARGYVGAELLTLLDAHPGFELALLGSRALAGQRLGDVATGIGAAADTVFEALEPADIARRAVDVLVLALPNGLAGPYVDAVDRVRPNTRIIDLSADYRFDETWAYGLPELHRDRLSDARRISNPGCYATAMQLAVAPLVDLADGAPVCFGVSGYSGAGTTPSPRNDPERLRDNLLPYTLTGHVHEREVSHHLNHPVAFMPHVAAFFRGLSVTTHVNLIDPHSTEDLLGRFETHYGGEPMVRVTADVPEVADIVGHPGACIGGVSVSEDETRCVVVSVLDNLLKGAASQALQNLNLACGFPEREGLNHHA